MSYYPEQTNRIKPSKWEKEIQGGNLCRICGDDKPCGNITGCAWWTS